MRRLSLALASAIAVLAFASFAPAQTPTSPPAASQSTVNLTMEQEHVIKELLKELKIEPQQAAVSETVGAAVPSSIKLQPIPDQVGQKVPQIKSHLFFIKDDRVYLVDPKDNSIAEVID